MTWTRRQFLGTAGAALGFGAGACLIDHARRRRGKKFIDGVVVAPSDRVGHRVLGCRPENDSPPVKTGVLIVGAGISGLGAAWKLARSGFTDFLVIDLESRPGGTSAFGESPVTGYPWGAHYIPLPTKDSTIVRELLADLGVLEGYDPLGEPIYSDRALCFAPQERLYVGGRWQEGLFPLSVATSTDLAQFRKFQQLMAGYRERKDTQGRRAFAIPVDSSSRDPDLIDLDRISMKTFLASHGLNSPRLVWYVEYCCRDDYGANLETTSAWAGIHYFAARPHGEEGQVLTWPEGNGWIVRRLSERLKDRFLGGRLAMNVETTPQGVMVDCLDVAADRAVRYSARSAILAIPKFVVRRLLKGQDPRSVAAVPSFTYAPWIVANLHVDRVPEGHGTPPCWDNVIYDSNSLGYVVATHQNLSTVPGPSVLTYYRSFFECKPAEGRHRLRQTSWESWRDAIIADLAMAHPDLEDRVNRLDVMLLGHAMVRPTVGLIWGEARQHALRSMPRVQLAHTDSSGLALFEEALHCGVRAAEASLADLG